MKRLPKLKGVKEILYPGQNKFLRYKINKNKNINLSKSLKIEIQKLLK